MCNSNCGNCGGKGYGAHLVVKILLIVGGINWGLVGLGMLMGGANWNIVNMLLGGAPMVEGIVYLLVGIAALVKLFYGRKCCGQCAVQGTSTPGMQ